MNKPEQVGNTYFDKRNTDFRSFYIYCLLTYSLKVQVSRKIDKYLSLMSSSSVLLYMKLSFSCAPNMALAQ